MRILHVLEHSVPRRSAYALRTMSILRQQRALGWHTIQLTGPRQGRVEADRNRDGWHFFRTEPARGAWALPLLQQLASLQRLARRLHAVARLTRPDILHAHAPALNALAALRVGRGLGLPVLFEAGAAWSDEAGLLRQRLGRGLETFVARHADAVATSSEGLRADLRARGIDRERITVVPNSIDIRRYSANQPRDAKLAAVLGLGAGPVIGHVGRLHPAEGLELLLAAMPALLGAWPALRLLLVGAGPHEAWLRERAARQGLDAAVIFAGAAGFEQRQAYHALIDVLVHPRLPLRLAELVPATGLLEAMAQGRLVAASDVGAHRELIEHGRTGMLFEAGSSAALADAVLALLSARASWSRLRAGARWFVEFERTWDGSVARYGPVYRELIERRRRR